jgi:hypothetical protein
MAEMVIRETAEEFESPALARATEIVGRFGSVRLAKKVGIYKGEILEIVSGYALQKTEESIVVLHNLKDLGHVCVRQGQSFVIDKKGNDGFSVSEYR